MGPPLAHTPARRSSSRGPPARRRSYRRTFRGGVLRASSLETRASFCAAADVAYLLTKGKGGSLGNAERDVATRDGCEAACEVALRISMDLAIADAIDRVRVN